MGFSFGSDEELAKLYTTFNAKEKTFFVTGDSSIFDKTSLENLGTVTGWKTDEFAKQLNAIPDKKVKRSSIDSLKSFIKIDGSVKLLPHKNADNVLEKLVNRGIVEDQFLLDEQYIVPRWREYAESIKNKSGGLFIVKGSLGNGKTIFMKGLSKYIANDNNVFYFNGKTEYFSEDLRKIKQNSNDSIIFIDDFYKVQQLFGSLKNKTKDMTFVISGRTPLIPQSLSVLLKQANFNDSDVIELANVDMLTENDISNWKRNMDRYSLWGKVDPNQVLNENRREFSMILVKYFESKGIYNEFKNSLIYNRRDSTTRIAIAALVSNLISSKVPLRTILNTLHEDLTSDMMSILSDLISFETHDINIKTNVLSKMLLQDPDVFQVSDIIQTIQLMMHGYDKIHVKESTVFSAKKELVSFSNLKLIVGKKRSKFDWETEIDLYYKNVQNLEFTKNNPFFWIQFANSKMNAAEWEIAKIYIENAYQSAKKFDASWEDDFQITTTEVNLYMESASFVLENDIEKFIDNMQKAVSLGTKNMKFDYLITIFAKLGEENVVSQLEMLDETVKVQLKDIFMDLYTYIRLIGDEDYNMNPPKIFARYWQDF